jgi:phosphoenolpyruvate synthase/pyruvate phosphate dikinase
MYTVPIGDAHQAAETGSKARQLGHLLRRGIPVPDGFVITAAAFDRFAKENDVDRLHWSAAEAQLADQREGREVVMPADVQTEIIRTFQKLRASFPAVAVRSSSDAEDWEIASFAGQYETFLNVRTTDELLDSVLKCWTSLFSSRVQHYANSKAALPDKTAMAVIVQGLVHSEVSGVAFTANPVTNDDTQILINASYGLGESIVSGEVTPDQYIVSKQNEAHIEKVLGEKEVKIEPDSSGTRTVPTTEQERNKYCLTDEELLHISKQCTEIEAMYGRPVDIEFGIEQGRLFVLQARPITT